MVAKSFADLERQMQDAMRRALQETVDASMSGGQNIMADFYNSPEPHWYNKRTGKFGGSLQKEDVSGSGNQLEATIYRNTNYVYPRGVGRYNGKVYGGYVPAEEVHGWAEEHSHGILGKGNTWQRTLEDIQHNLNAIFGAYFR